MKNNLFIQDRDFLSEDQKRHINEVILQPNFPFYLQQNAAPADGNEGLCHIGLARPELRPPESNQFDFNSSFGPFALSMLNAFATKNKIKVKEMLRAAVNLTFATASGKSGTHVDHNFDHTNLLIYLNDPEDKESATVLVDEGVEHRISPEKFKGICFESTPHYATFPKYGSRVVAAISFLEN
tara:strand:+ start:349 stop:897 length:549 start_codon:yes stop_codon:yes gene_type:complete